MQLMHIRTSFYVLLLATCASADPVEVVVTADGRALPGEAAYGTPKQAATDPALRKEPEPIHEPESLSYAEKLFSSLKGTSDTGAVPANLPKEKVIRVISDTHAGGCWFRDKVNQKKLMQFFEGMASGSDNTALDALVLNGDILELGLVNLRSRPKCPKEIFTSEDEHGFDVKRFNQLIQKVSQHVPTYFTVGNHDVYMEEKLVREAWGDHVKFMGDDFSMHGICFTNGHKQDLAAHAPEGSGMESLAYYVSRASTHPEASSCDVGKGFAMRPGWQVHAAEGFWGVAMNQLHGKMGNEAVEFLAQPENFQKYTVGLLSAALKLPKADIDELAKYPVPGANKQGPRYHEKCNGDGKSFTGMEDNYTLADVVEDHKFDLQKAIDKYGSNHTVKMFRSTMMDYSGWASTQCQQDCKAQIIGHSHVPELKKLPCTYYEDVDKAQWRDDKVEKPRRQKEIMYGNSGAWTHGPFEQRMSTYIDITVACEAADAQLT
jgi:UDP-2,3-diacylglucosamine pyrophosphatase LpxH